ERQGSQPARLPPRSHDRRRLGVDEFLLVYGARPAAGQRTRELTVRSMLAGLRRFSESAAPAELRAGVTTRLTPLAGWKQEADFLFVQACFDLGALLRWRDSIGFAGRVLAGV